MRTILARNVADAIRAQGRQKRDIARERSLEAQLEAYPSARRLAGGENSAPSQQAVRHEQAVLLANALARLPNSQREALVLHYWQGCSLAEDRATPRSYRRSRGRSPQARIEPPPRPLRQPAINML